MRSFTKISPKIWRSARVRSLSIEAKLLLVYLLTAPHLTMCGCYHLPDGYAIEDLGWEPDRYRKARAELEDAGLIEFDANTSEILIVGHFQFNSPTNDKHHLGAKREAEVISSEILRTKTLDALSDALTARRQDADQREREAVSNSPNGRRGRALHGAPNSNPSMLKEALERRSG